MSDIFISYEREEQRVARKLAVALEKEGWSVWWDPKLRTGEHFDDNYGGAPTDGSPWLEAKAGDCGQRLIRGGSWYNDLRKLRSSYRHANNADFRNIDLGF